MHSMNVPVGHCIDCDDITCPTCFKTQHDCTWCIEFYAWMYAGIVEGK